MCYFRWIYLLHSKVNLAHFIFTWPCWHWPVDVALNLFPTVVCPAAASWNPVIFLSWVHTGQLILRLEGWTALSLDVWHHRDGCCNGLWTQFVDKFRSRQCHEDHLTVWLLLQSVGPCPVREIHSWWTKTTWGEKKSPSRRDPAWNGNLILAKQGWTD